MRDLKKWIKDQKAVLAKQMYECLKKGQTNDFLRGEAAMLDRIALVMEEVNDEKECNPSGNL